MRISEACSCGAALLFEGGDLGRDIGPIEFFEQGEFFQPGERIEPGLQPVALLLDSADLAGDLLQTAFEPAAPGLQRGDLGAVAPAEHITAAIVDAVAIVLLVPAGRVLDLAGAGDGARLASELFCVVQQATSKRCASSRSSQS